MYLSNFLCGLKHKWYLFFAHLVALYSILGSYLKSNLCNCTQNVTRIVCSIILLLTGFSAAIDVEESVAIFYYISALFHSLKPLFLTLSFTDEPLTYLLVVCQPVLPLLLPEQQDFRTRLYLNPVAFTSHFSFVLAGILSPWSIHSEFDLPVVNLITDNPMYWKSFQ